MDSLEALTTQVQALSGRPDDLTHLLGLLNKAEDLLSKQSVKLAAAMANLDPAKHSLGWLFMLEAQVSSPAMRDQSEQIISRVASFLSTCSADQIQLAPEKFNSLCVRFKEHILARKEYARAILPLQSAVRKLQPSTEHLTPQHADFVQMCLLAKCYRAALPILDDDIFEIDPKRTVLQPRDFLLYCYYGGMICVGLKQFHRALEFFHHTITAPANVLSAITVAAYKKFILVSLIVNGQVPPFPKFTPSVVQRNLKSSCQDYIDLATAYLTRDVTELKRCVASREEALNTDSNLGLAKQVIASVYKRNIQRLTQTYLTLSLEDIASTVQLEGPREAEMHVLRMIEDGEIFASINQRDGMVRFQEDPEQYNTREMVEKLDGEIQRTIRLAKKVVAMDEHVSCDKTYLNKITMKERGARYGDPDDFELGSQKVFDSM